MFTSSTDNRDSVIFLGNDAASDRYLDIGTTGGSNAATLGGIFGRSRGSINFPDLVRGADLNDGEWHHVAYSADAMAGVTQLYIDGVLAGTTSTPAFSFPATAPLTRRPGGCKCSDLRMTPERALAEIP